MFPKRSLLMTLALLVWLPAGAQAPGGVKPPVAKDSVRFAAIGDWGTGDRESYETAAQLAKSRGTFPFDFVVTLGDNIYGRERPSDLEKKFERPFKPLLDAGVKFYASLGNHDETNQIHYKLFNMNGRRYYTFKPRDGVRFFALDTNYMDPEQVAWLKRELEGSGSDWKICYFHHPLYSSGERHGPSTELRAILEPLFLKHGVNLVLSGHEHFYERIHPQRGIYYFISGAGGKLRRGGMRRSEITAAGNDRERSYLLFEVDRDEIRFQAITRTGQSIDSGVLERPARAKAVSESRD